MDTFQQFINPFDVGIPKNLLINISSGKTFIAECEADIRRFEKSIKRTPTIAKFFSR